jgi:hypothetical protein
MPLDMIKHPAHPITHSVQVGVCEGFYRVPPQPAGRLARCQALFRNWRYSRCLRELEPRLARDIGVASTCDRGPANFAVDPRPLWGVGLIPQPITTYSRWKV